ncbi:MAG: molybdenum cofactor biosynthesis protein MoaE [Bryobacterales bacterium]|jgi:molybdopterin synthase catalytic subunit|nr:molybdenum cofactor biosynthesis protein MoaE [Bryobacterales bacterium]
MSAPIHIQVLFFGQLRDFTGTSQMQWELPAGSTSTELFAAVTVAFPQLESMRASIVLARNAEFLHQPVALSDGDEVALLPPVSGGSDAAWLHQIRTPEGHFFGLTRMPIDGGKLARDILRQEDGAFVNFEGVVRNQSGGRSTRYLDYECYEALAIKTMAAIGEDLARKHAVGRVAIVHRLGRMEIGETSVAVVVCSPHRRPAFEAALEGINRVKSTVPIWKKEYFVDGEVWVEGEWSDDVKPGG